MYQPFQPDSFLFDKLFIYYFLVNYLLGGSPAIIISHHYVDANNTS
jgi:hypothetical protein